MKTVTIEGIEYKVPDEATYRAMDADGEWWWYIDKPMNNSDRVKTSGVWFGDGHYEYIVKTKDIALNWTDSLTVIE